MRVLSDEFEGEGGGWGRLGYVCTCVAAVGRKGRGWEVQPEWLDMVIVLLTDG